MPWDEAMQEIKPVAIAIIIEIRLSEGIN